MIYGTSKKPSTPRVNGRNLGHTQRKQGHDGHGCPLYILKGTSNFVKKKALRQGPKNFFKHPFDDDSMGYKVPPEIRMTADEAIALMHVLIDAIRRDGPASHNIERLFKHLEKFDDKIFTYLEHEGVPPDNTEVERIIRYFVAHRKISGKLISPDLVAMENKLLSVYHTCKLNGVAIDGVLENIIKGDATAALNRLGLDGDRLPNPSPPHLPALVLASS